MFHEKCYPVVSELNFIDYRGSGVFSLRMTSIHIVKTQKALLIFGQIQPKHTSINLSSFFKTFKIIKMMMMMASLWYKMLSDSDSEIIKLLRLNKL